MATVRKRQWTSPSGEPRQSWQVSYRDGSGKRRSKQFDRRRDADAFRIKAESEVLAGVHTPDSASITVAEAADLWIAKAINNARERGTVKGYQELARLHIVPVIGAERLSRLSMPRVEAFADVLVETRSRAMASKAVRALSSILTESMRRGLVGQNVARAVTVKRSARDRKRIEIPSASHLRALLAAAPRLGARDPAIAVMVKVAMLTGLRSSELRGLSWSDVDLKGGKVSVSQRADRWNSIGPPKSGAGFRTIPIGPELVSALTAWKLRCPPSPGDLVLPNRAGKPMSQHSAIKRFTALQVEAGLTVKQGGRPRYGLHSLRHAAASAWIKQGIDLKRLQVWMGHSSIQITVNTYGHLITDARGDAALASGAESILLA